MADETEEQASEEKSGGSSKVKMIVLAAAVVIIAIGAVYFFKENSMTQETSSTSTKITQAPSPTPTHSMGGEVITASYTCAEGKIFDAKFNNDTDMSADVTLSDGTTMNLVHTMSADGAKYANSDESFVLWTKGNTAFIEENGTRTYSDCTSS